MKLLRLCALPCSYRQDIHPSFKVSKKKNRWYDLATLESGDIIDLGKLIYGTSDIITVIESMHAYDGNVTVRNHIRKEKVKEDPFAPFMDVRALPLAARPLLSYLTSRSIDVEIAVRYCVEIHYRLGPREYYALGFENVRHGFEARNPSFKGCMTYHLYDNTRQTMTSLSLKDSWTSSPI